MFKDDVKPLSRKSDIVTQDTGEEILIYDLIANKAYNLNQTSALIWQLCDGKTSVSDITKYLADNLNAPITEDFVWLGLEQLKKDSLLENEAEVIPNYGGLSRREVIKKVGFASLVALPLVSSLIAPMAVNAQSAICAGACQCPNATVVFCSPGGGSGTLVCNNLTTLCRCQGPFGAPGSGATPGQKSGSCSSL